MYCRFIIIKKKIMCFKNIFLIKKKLKGEKELEGIW